MALGRRYRHYRRYRRYHQRKWSPPPMRRVLILSLIFSITSALPNPGQVKLKGTTDGGPTNEAPLQSTPKGTPSQDFGSAFVVNGKRYQVYFFMSFISLCVQNLLATNRPSAVHRLRLCLIKCEPSCNRPEGHFKMSAQSAGLLWTQRHYRGSGSWIPMVIANNGHM